MGGFAGSREAGGRPCQIARDDLVTGAASEADAQTIAGATVRLGVWRGRRLSHGQWQVRAAARPQLSGLVDGVRAGAGGFGPELVLRVDAGSSGDQSPDLHQP